MLKAISRKFGLPPTTETRLTWRQQQSTAIWRRIPQKKGVDVGEGIRAYFAPPIRILYLVREQDRIVEVLRVRRL
jgi:hypothetical protein